MGINVTLTKSIRTIPSLQHLKRNAVSLPKSILEKYLNCDPRFFITWQVHACNILRALYRETKLGEDVFPFVSDGIVVAVTGFYSDSWAVSKR